MSCLVYDTAKYRYYMHGVSIAFIAIALGLAIAFYLVVRQRFGNDKDQPPKEVVHFDKTRGSDGPEVDPMDSIKEEQENENT